ncbi:MAG: xanthine dehydrogenase family protein subunit M [Deltaproteobacteria bacterium]|nr:xanthine dehydrogenase family protein subunit M [Deltaproteobacteria bacterium]
MLLPRFDYQEPQTVTEALDMMASFKDKAKILAGGTDLLVNLKRGLVETREVVSVHRLKGLTGIKPMKTGLKIGPLTTAAQLAASGADLGRASVLAAAAARLGSPLIRNRATVGGNLVTARPASDMAPPLMALGAKVVLSRQGGRRTVELDQYFQGPGLTVINPDEILTSIVIPPLEPGSGCGYLKLGIRKTLEIAMVNVAAFLTLDGQGTISQARIVLGAVGPTPLRAKIAESLLVGERPKGPNDPILVGAGLAAVNDARPIDDHRGSAEYRRLMVETLTRRALAQAWRQAEEG